MHLQPLTATNPRARCRVPTHLPVHCHQTHARKRLLFSCTLSLPSTRALEVCDVRDTPKPDLDRAKAVMSWHPFNSICLCLVLCGRMHHAPCGAAMLTLGPDENAEIVVPFKDGKSQSDTGNACCRGPLGANFKLDRAVRKEASMGASRAQSRVNDVHHTTPHHSTHHHTGHHHTTHH